MMARYVGDLTDPKNSEERENVAVMVDRLAATVRNRRVTALSIAYDRDLIDSGEFRISPGLSPLTVNIQAVTRRGRHQKRLGGGD